jgi:hypothetical protein
MNKSLMLILLGLVCILPRNALAAASVPVTLNGLPVDSALPSFTDPGSGVAFSNPVDAGGPGPFIVDFWNAFASLPTLTPGLVVSSGGYAGNGVVSLPNSFSLTMILPVPASEVDMTMAYELLDSGSPATITLRGFDSSFNQVIASTTIFPPRVAFHEQSLSLVATTGITRVTVTPTNLFDAFGRISFTPVPEPSTFALAALAAVTLLAARRRFSCLPLCKADRVLMRGNDVRKCSSTC